jgi:twinkle protein
LYENTEDGSRFYKCFACGKSYQHRGARVEDIEIDGLIEETTQPKDNDTSNASDAWFKFKEPHRGLLSDTLNTYEVEHTDKGIVRFPEKSYKGALLASKTKYLDKTFQVTHYVNKGFQQAGLFGAWLFPAGSSRYITVTEGEEDAMSVYELTGSKFPCVSLKNGNNSVLSQEDKKYLDSFETVIYCGDMDAPGIAGAEKFATSFDKSKVRIVKLSGGFKDANDISQRMYALFTEGKRDEAEVLAKTFTKDWWNAKPYSPEGLVQGNATLDLFMNEKESASIPYPWQGLQEILHGIRTSELIVLTAGSGVGKTAVIRELAYHIYKAVPDAKVGCIFLEESIKRTVKDFVGIELNQNLRLPENVVDKKVKQDAWNTLFDNDRWIFWDHFGSNDVDTVCNQVRFIANNFGAKYIFLDHISIIVSDGSNGDERKTLDAIMTKLRTLAQELDVCLFLVSHLRRSNDSTPHEEGGVTSLSQLRGSAGIGQLADIVVGLERNGQADNTIERNLTTLRILKNRYTGETGPACYLLWEKERGRLKEIKTYKEVEALIQAEEENFNGDLPPTEGV